MGELGAGEGFSPADPVPPIERVEAEEDVLASLLVGELGVSAVAAGDTVAMGGHEDAGSALGADGLGPDELVALDLVGVLLRACLGCCILLSCHRNHSSAGAGSSLAASMPFLFSRYSLSSSRAASLDS